MPPEVNEAADAMGYTRSARLLRVQLPLAIPLIFAGPGVRRGHRVREPVSHVDLVPTLLYGLGFPIARDLDGAVLTDAFEKGSDKSNEPGAATVAPPSAL